MPHFISSVSRLIQYLVALILITPVAALYIACFLVIWPLGHVLKEAERIGLGLAQWGDL